MTLPSESPAPDKRVIASWALYDFANTIFSMNVISLYFALWVTVDHGGPDILYSVALSGSMLAVALSVPVYGAISDQTGRRRIPLTILTLVSVVATACIGQTDHLLTGIFFFVIANYCYQSALVFYNGMLPSVARGSHVGLVSGYGVSLGYLGSIAGLLLVKPFVEAGGRSAAFIPTAALFLIFSIPCFLFVKNPEVNTHKKVQIGHAFHTLKQTLANASEYKLLLKFILIHFLILDVVNTVIAFMSVYANKVMHFTDAEITTFLISSTAAAMIGSYLIGWMVKHKGTGWCYALVLWLWVAALSIAILSQSQLVFWLVGPLAGMGMGGVWVVSRAYIVELSPPEKLGEFFGLYGLAGKAASILGPLLWGTVVWIFQDTQTFKYRAALTALLLITIGTLFLFRSLQRQIAQKDTY
ncbi:MAG: MFS transporter [Nitrospinae bacterium]|nr:MFS transporter [Nitrospinota bacterium]MDA1109613.1 MFS transporter [Nitrospinota bacterium]